MPKVADEGVVIRTEKREAPAAEVGATATRAGLICAFARFRI